MQEQYTTHTPTNKDKTLGKLLFKKKFGLTEEEFQQGLVDEELYEVRGIDGKLKYYTAGMFQSNLQSMVAALALSLKRPRQQGRSHV